MWRSPMAIFTSFQRKLGQLSWLRTTANVLICNQSVTVTVSVCLCLCVSVCVCACVCVCWHILRILPGVGWRKELLANRGHLVFFSRTPISPPLTPATELSLPTLLPPPPTTRRALMLWVYWYFCRVDIVRSKGKEFGQKDKNYSNTNQLNHNLNSW